MDEIEDFAVSLAAAVTVRPGDTLIVALSNRLLRDQADTVLSMIRQHLPDEVSVLLIDQVSALGVVKGS